jgi:hypothetical protein
MSPTDSSVFFIIGGQRCGTTALRRVLASHPEVAVLEPESPEPKTFLRDGSSPSASEYLARFGTSAAAYGEKSTSYLDIPSSAGRIQATFPDARVIAVVRNPIERAISHYRFSVDNGAEGLDARQALTKEAERRPFDRIRYSVSPFLYLTRGEYVNALQPWVDVFGVNRVLVVVLERLLTDASALNAIHLFIGVDPTLGDAFERANASRSDVPALDDAFVGGLRDHFTPFNRSLHEQFGLDLQSWGSDV